MRILFKGVLYVHVNRATNLISDNETDLISKIKLNRESSYVKLTGMDVMKKTKNADHYSNNPEWNESFNFVVDNRQNNPLLKLEVYNIKGENKDHLLGR